MGAIAAVGLGCSGGTEDSGMTTVIGGLDQGSAPRGPAPSGVGVGGSVLPSKKDAGGIAGDGAADPGDETPADEDTNEGHDVGADPGVDESPPLDEGAADPGSSDPGPEPTRCPDDTHLCGDECIDDASVEACGAACERCESGPGEAPVCDRGVCAVVCEEGFHACGAACLPDDHPASCGDRCAPCPAGAGEVASCDGGLCATSCEEGLHRCDGGCVPDDAPASCGESCEPCPAGDGEEAVCIAGACAVRCLGPTHRCGDTCVPDDDPDVCGLECRRCPDVRFGTRACVAGECVATCEPGWRSCRGRCMGEGRLSCGDECTVCPLPPAGEFATCVEGSCSTRCFTRHIRCDGVCIDPWTDTHHCGDCDTECAGGQVCSGGFCFSQCTEGTEWRGAPVLDELPLDATGFSPGDTDGDGVEDLVLVGGAPGRLQILSPGPDGTRTRRVSLDLNARASEVVARDLDGDGRAEAVIVLPDDAFLAIAKDVGFGAVDVAHTIAVGLEPRELRVLDLDETGTMDLLVASGGEAAIYVSRRADDGSWPHATRHAIATPAERFDAGDVDGDGFGDLVVTDGTGPDQIDIHLGDGQGAFAFAYELDMPRIGDVRVADVDDTPPMEVVLTADSGWGLTVLSLDGGLEVVWTDPWITDSARRIHVGDIDGDGLKDIALVGAAPDSGPTAYDLALSPGLDSLERAQPFRWRVGVDFGHSAILGEGSDEPTLEWLVPGVPGALAALHAAPAAGFEVGETVALAPGPAVVLSQDLDGRGGEEILVLGRCVPRMDVLSGVTDGLAHGRSAPLDAPVSDATLIAFDGDSILDLVLAEDGAPEDCTIANPLDEPYGLRILRGDGQGGFLPSDRVALDGPPVEVLSPDLDWDRCRDLVTRARVDEDATSTPVWVALGRCEGTVDVPLRRDVEGRILDMALFSSSDAPTTEIVALRQVGDAPEEVVLLEGLAGDEPFAVTPLVTSAGARTLDVLDANGDGSPNLVLGTPGDLFVLVESSDGSYNTRRAVHSWPVSSLGLLGRDRFGRRQILTIGTGGDISILLGGPDGLMTRIDGFLAGHEAMAAHVDRDGIPELAAFDSRSGLLRLVRGTCAR